MDDADALVARLLGRRLRPDEKPAIDGPGVYALFLSNRGNLPGITVGELDVVYVGMTKRTSKARSHFKSNSASSSPRRTLGAVLKKELHLTAHPRGRGLSKNDFSHYYFGPAGEAALTAWMRDYLTYSYVVITKDVASIEQRLISRLTPPLNVDNNWHNPDEPALLRLRELCREEASAKDVAS